MVWKWDQVLRWLQIVVEDKGRANNQDEKHNNRNLLFEAHFLLKYSNDDAGVGVVVEVNVEEVHKSRRINVEVVVDGREEGRVDHDGGGDVDDEGQAGDRGEVGVHEMEVDKGDVCEVEEAHSVAVVHHSHTQKPGQMVVFHLGH